MVRKHDQLDHSLDAGTPGVVVKPGVAVIPGVGVVKPAGVGVVMSGVRVVIPGVRVVKPGVRVVIRGVAVVVAKNKQSYRYIAMYLEKYMAKFQ